MGMKDLGFGIWAKEDEAGLNTSPASVVAGALLAWWSDLRECF
jgi:hypothetical protein